MLIHPNGSTKTEAVQRGLVQDESKLKHPVDAVGQALIESGDAEAMAVDLKIIDALLATAKRPRP